MNKIPPRLTDGNLGNLQSLPFSSANVHVTWIFHNQTQTAKNNALIDFWNYKPLQYIHYKSDSFPAENKESYNQMKLAAEKIARAYDQISEVPLQWSSILQYFLLVPIADFQGKVKFITLKPGIWLSSMKNITTIKILWDDD